MVGSLLESPQFSDDSTSCRYAKSNTQAPSEADQNDDDFMPKERGYGENYENCYGHKPSSRCSNTKSETSESTGLVHDIPIHPVSSWFEGIDYLVMIHGHQYA
jgi:hypothetical protein